MHIYIYIYLVSMPRLLKETVKRIANLAFCHWGMLYFRGLITVNRPIVICVCRSHEAIYHSPTDFAVRHKAHKSIELIPRYLSVASKCASRGARPALGVPVLINQ